MNLTQAAVGSWWITRISCLSGGSNAAAAVVQFKCQLDGFITARSNAARISEATIPFPLPYLDRVIDSPRDILALLTKANSLTRCLSPVELTLHSCHAHPCTCTWILQGVSHGEDPREYEITGSADRQRYPFIVLLRAFGTSSTAILGCHLLRLSRAGIQSPTPCTVIQALQFESGVIYSHKYTHLLFAPF